jgi:tetratricopeptide (TPR) repeat protein
MSKKLISGLVVIFAALSIGAYFTFRPHEPSELEIPDLSPRTGESTPSVEWKKAQANLVRYRGELRQHPDQIKNYIEVSQIYIEEARVTGKHHQYIPLAQHVIDAALKVDPESFEANIVKASMLMTLHQFQEARVLAEKAVARNPYNSFAYGVLCDAHVELGEYAKAVEDCDMMMKARPDLRSYARASYLRELHGDRDGAIGAMKLAADAGVYGAESREWALYNLGNIFLGMGKLDTAAFIYKGILEERPSYAFAMSGMASVAAARKNYQDAIAWLVKATQLTSEHIFIEQLADLYTAMGQKESAKTLEDKALEAFKLHEEGGWNVNREYAAFCLNHDIHIPEALARAKKDYDSRPQNIDALDTYAWALYKNGQPQAALPLIGEAMRMHTQNGLLHYHAAMIEYALGKKQEAAAELHAAFAATPYLNVLIVDKAHEMLTSLGTLASNQ